MLFRLTCASGVLFILLGGAAGASPCTDRIHALETRVNEMAEATASVSSGGQGVAAARESQAMQSRNQGEPITAPTVPPFQNETREAQATREAARTGGGGDRVMQARARLNEARALDQKGDGTACLRAVEDIERQLGPR